MREPRTKETRQTAAAGLGILAAAGLALAACGSGSSRADVCERVVDQLYGGPGNVTVVDTKTIEGALPEVAVQFRPSGTSTGATSTVTCTFAGKAEDPRFDLVGVRRADSRPLHLISVIFLKRRLRAEQND